MVQLNPQFANLARVENSPTVRDSSVSAPDAFFGAPVRKAFTIWGLSPRQLHDAFWRAKGVQCVCWGQPQRLQRAAELFLLLDPVQYVLFDLASLSDRLTWRDAAVTRLRLTGPDQQAYSERVIIDDRGLVQRIERRYRPEVEHCGRVLITSMHRIATAWMESKSRRQGWERVRRLLYWSRVDHLSAPGVVLRQNEPGEERQMMTELVERWPYPNQAIAGLIERQPGVWCAATEPAPREVVHVGPLWLGCGASKTQSCIIGPAWIEDRIDGAFDGAFDAAAVNIKDILEVQPFKVDLPARQSDETIAAEDSALAGSLLMQPDRRYEIVKRVMDIAGSLMALLITLPVMALVAAAILIDDGRPLFFGHIRQGRGGRRFRCWKFRTMRRNAHQMARQLQAQNLCDGPQVLIRDDPRITRLGRFLRAANLDELPQFWNVLKGDMSLVGPRPSPDDENQFCPAWRDLRLSVRPGITGLWQIYRTRAPGNDFQEWIKFDTLYVGNASLWLDLRIVFKTAFMLLTPGSGRGKR